MTRVPSIPTLASVPVIGRGVAPPFSPAELFANGEQGAWFDPSDLSSMFQDAAGTTPAAYGQPVGLILDKSGNGNHASQATATARPTLMQDAGGRPYLSFDGVDDFMVTGIVDFSTTDEMLAIAGVHKLNSAGTTSPAILNGDTGSTTGAFALYAPHTATRQYGWSVGGGSQNFRAVDGGLAAPHTAVQSLLSKISSANSDARLTARLDGVTLTTFSSNIAGTATPAFRADTFRIGAQLATYFKGRIYSLIVRGKLPTDDELAGAENHVAQKTGVTL